METAVRVEKAVKRFGKTLALDRVSFSSSQGINIILGPNGAGKSTLLRCIDGLYRVDSGSISVLGVNPYTEDNIKSKLSLLTENYALYDFLTVIDNLKFFGKLYGLKTDRTVEIARGLLKELDAYQYADRKVETLSRGTKQKVAFCRALLNDPDVLLLDEPTAFLDANSAQSVRRIMLDYAKRKKTVLFVTQKLDEVTRYEGRISILKDGKIVKQTTTEGLYGSVLKNSVVNIRVAKPLDIRIIRKLPGFVSANGDKATLIKFRVRDYKEVNGVVGRLADKGTFVVGVDYVEPFIEDITR